MLPTRRDLDPEVQQVMRRVLLIRRMAAKHEGVSDKVKEALMKSIAGGGEEGDDEEHGKDEEEGFQGKGPRHWMRVELGRYGITFDENANMVQDGEMVIPFFDIPWQQLKSEVELRLKNGRVAKAAEKIKAYEGMTELDSEVLQRIMKGRTKQKKESYHAPNLGCKMDRRKVV